MATVAEPVFRTVEAQPVSIPTGARRVRTVVVDDSETFLQVVCELLELDPLVDVVARAACEDSGAMDFVHKENFRQEFCAVLEQLTREPEEG